MDAELAASLTKLRNMTTNTGQTEKVYPSLVQIKTNVLIFSLDASQAWVGEYRGPCP